MPLVVGDLEPRKLEQWRTEIAETLAAQLSYPPYFDHRAGREVVRPVDRAKRDEIEQFVHSVNFSPLDRTDVTSPEVRRFLEQLLRRYVDVNPHLHRSRSARRLPSLRGRTPRVAAEIHRSLLAFISGAMNSFGVRRPQRSWSGAETRAQMPSEKLEHNTLVLEAVLARRGDEPPMTPMAPSRPARTPTPGGPGPRPAGVPSPGWMPGPSQATIPVPLTGNGNLPSGSPFASLAAGAQSALFGSASITDSPTGPLPAIASPVGASPNGARLPEDLYRIYGDYLHDMQPEAFSRGSVQTPPAPSAPLWSAPRPAPEDQRQTGPMPQPPAVRSTPPAGGIARQTEPRGDLLIFFQLRYQLEAYVRRAARSYGIQTRSDDPSGVIDALRRSRFVDEADLRLAEGILAVTDRVTNGGEATIEDYRQALTLYLLYHRSHLDG